MRGQAGPMIIQENGQMTLCIINFAKVQMPREPLNRPCEGRSSDFSPIVSAPSR